jgi:hypothetical protein
MIRLILVLLLCAPAVLPAGASPITMAALQQKLAAEVPARGLDQATADELQQLLPSEGGTAANLLNGQYIVKIGMSTFIVDMRLITLVTAFSLFVVLLFFTPLGLWMFKGRLHVLFGNLLAMTGVAPEFGRHLAIEPKRYLHREGNVRRAFALYMHNEFIPEYRNNITAIAFIGTAFLILNIGLRGIKFMVAHQPDMIIIAILVEITVLCLLGMTTWYEKSMPEAPSAAPALPGADLRLADVLARVDRLREDLENAQGATAHATR